MSLTRVIARLRSVRSADVPVAAGAAPAVGVVEVGSFAHGACERCEWRGPGRRARGQARLDAQAHGEVCGETAKVCAPDRERLTAHGRS